MTRIQIESGSIIQVSDEDLVGALDTLLANAAWLIARQSKGNRDLMDAFVERESEHLFVYARRALNALAFEWELVPEFWHQFSLNALQEEAVSEAQVQVTALLKRVAEKSKRGAA